MGGLAWVLNAIADSLLMGVGFFFGMLYMREKYLRVLEEMEKQPGGSFKKQGGRG